MEQLAFVKKQGKDILNFAHDFAKLRIAIFRDFPYLYDGTLEYELDYIQTYSACENALVFAVYDEKQMVGATTCIPMKNETENIQKPFLNTGYDIDTVFYFGESILLRPYRGRGLGHRFFDEREQFARSFGTYRLTTFCAVNRPEEHPLKPHDYIPNDAFWEKREYARHTELTCEMNWPDLNETKETSKTLTFWLKPL